ncbi:PilZ domain-containing protein [Paenibacillus sp. sgz302251]|uniref:PilZ domain-containing protein n=1 Tax=Paenibacillus sp. sgz302251 TaxID=3414493 RepID=UPI003C7A0D80
MGINRSDSSRAHLRLRFKEGIIAELRLVSRKGQLLTSSSSTVRILNLSQNGLCFLTGLQLPVQHNYLAEFKMTISNVQLVVRGRIVWRATNGNEHAHGVVFECSDAMRSLIIGVMNQELLESQPQQQKIHYIYSRLLHKQRTHYSS